MEIAGQLNRASAAEAPRKADTRFRKGQSGNPRGRPRKVTAVDDPGAPYCETSMYELVRGEAYRPVRVRRGDRSIEMSAIRAGLREMSLKAAKGNRLALTALMQLMLRTEAAEARQAAAASAAGRIMPPRRESNPEVAAAEEYKEVWSRVLLDGVRIGAAIEPPSPHPDDVTIARVGGTFSWPGSAPEETLSLNTLAAKHGELAARLPELRRNIEALPYGYEKVLALCLWFEQDDLRRVIARNLPGRYYVDPDADRGLRGREGERQTREWAQSRRWAFEEKMEEEQDDGCADVERDVAAAGEAVADGHDGVAEPAEAARAETEAGSEQIADEVRPGSVTRGAPQKGRPAADAGTEGDPAAVAEALVYVRTWKAALDKAKALRLAISAPLPHPDHVLIDEETGIVEYRQMLDGDAAATIERAREGLAQIRQIVAQYVQDLSWTDESELDLVRRKLEGMRAVCAAMEAALESGPDGTG